MTENVESCEFNRHSKIFPTRELCEKGLYEYIYKNHNCPAEEIQGIIDQYYTDGKFKEYFAKKIIESKQK